MLISMILVDLIDSFRKEIKSITKRLDKILTENLNFSKNKANNLTKKLAQKIFKLVTIILIKINLKKIKLKNNN